MRMFAPCTHAVEAREFAQLITPGVIMALALLGPLYRVFPQGNLGGVLTCIIIEVW